MTLLNNYGSSLKEIITFKELIEMLAWNYI